MNAVTALSSAVSEIQMQLQNLRADIEGQAADSDAADVTNAESALARNSSIAAVEQVREVVESLDPTDSSRVEELRQLINAVQAEYESADLSGVYQSMVRRLQEQREMRQELEAELEGMSGEIQRLRHIRSVLPTGCNGET